MSCKNFDDLIVIEVSEFPGSFSPRNFILRSIQDFSLRKLSDRGFYICNEVLNWYEVLVLQQNFFLPQASTVLVTRRSLDAWGRKTFCLSLLRGLSQAGSGFLVLAVCRIFSFVRESLFQLILHGSISYAIKFVSVIVGITIADQQIWAKQVGAKSARSRRIP